MASFRQRTDSGIAVEDSVEEFGVLLITGSATALIDGLSFEEVNGLLPRETFEQAKSRATQQPAPRRTRPPERDHDVPPE